MNKMDARTREQEQRYVMALGYAYGRKDATPFNSDNSTRTLLVGSMDFAAWYSIHGESGTLEMGWEHFSTLNATEQRALARECARMAYSPYEEMRKMMRERQGN